MSNPSSRSSTRPKYHIGLTKEELSGTPKQRLEALLSSSSTAPLSPSESKPQTAVLATLYSSDSITPPRQPTNHTGSKFSSAQSSSRSSPGPPPARVSSAIRPNAMTMREPSLDSTMSSTSSTLGPHTPGASVDIPSSTYSDSSAPISSSASVDATVRRLVKDKQTLTTRNEQLWQLVEKQRSMIIELKDDVEKLAIDRERYRQKLKDERKVASSYTSGVAGHAAAMSTDSTTSSQVGPSDLSLRNPPPRTITETPEPGGEDEQEQKRNVPAPLPLRSTRTTQGPGSPDQTMTPKSLPVSPDVTSPGGSKKKAPPTPLNLLQGPPPVAPTFHGQSSTAQDDSREANGEFDLDRGRRRTREDDDFASEENRSRSKKEKSSKSKSKGPQDDTAPLAAAPDASDMPSSLSQPIGLPSSPRAPLLGGLQSPLQFGTMGSLAGMMGARDLPQMVSAPNLGALSALKSPGLPMSPRPGNRPPQAAALRNQPQFVSAPLMSSGPMSARGAMLSPRPPRQAIPLPNASQFGSMNAHLARAELYAPHQSSFGERVDSKQGSNASSEGKDVGPVYTGFMSSDNPDQLLPPGALHLIDVETYSSRLRPSSQISTNSKTSDDDLVFTLAVHARSDGAQVWRVEKTLTALYALDSTLRRMSGFPAKLPDKSLFAGHAPVKVDQRRAALDEYFAVLLGSQLDDGLVRLIAGFLSTDVIGPRDERYDHTTTESYGSPRRKEGYLAKQGKVLGGWKARYFVLDGKELIYFESPGGDELGSIRLSKAQIASQNTEDSSENTEFRHGFLILEQKREDSSNLIRHILCAESDQERDGWMSALRSHIEMIDREGSPSATSSPKHSATLQRAARPALQPHTNELQALGYDQTVTAGAPVMGSPTPSSASDSPVESQASMGIPSIHTNFDRPPISGPVAGGPIQNASAWGNKPVKESKRNIFGFKSRHLEDSASSGGRSGTAIPIAQHHSGRAVFGMNLAEAVDLFPPAGVDICLPAPVYRCVEWLEAHNAAQEQGLFRQSGSQTGILGLKERFNIQGDINLLEDSTLDCHTIASVLKMYLRELPESVLTRPMHLDFLRVLEVRHVPEKLTGLNILAHRLPEPNFELLSTVFRYLVEVVANSDRNLMGVKNLATIWTAALSIPAPLIDHFITNHNAIFGECADDAASPIIQAIDSGSPVSTSPGGIDELRSPRKQMFTDLVTPMPDQLTFGSDAHGNPSTHQHTYEYANPNAQVAFRGATPLNQHYHTRGDHSFGSLNAALAPSMTLNPPSPRRDEPSKLLKKSRRESSIRSLGISAPIMNQDSGSAGPSSPGLMSPGFGPMLTAEKRKSSIHRLREMAGFKDDS